jgi:hypothetical protein
MTIMVDRGTINDRLVLTYDPGQYPSKNVADLLLAISRAYDIIPDERHVETTKAHDGDLRAELLAQLIQGFSEAGCEATSHNCRWNKDSLEQSVDYNRKIRDTIDNELSRIRSEEESPGRPPRKKRARLKTDHEKAREELQTERQAFELERRIGTTTRAGASVVTY